MALAFGALNVLGFEVWFRNGCGPDRCFPSVFEIATKFPQRKSDNILPYFHGRNSVAICLRCVIAHKTLSSPFFYHENTAMGCPIFKAKIQQSFMFGVLWCTSRVSRLCIQHISTCLHHDKLKPFKASSMLMRVAYIGKPISLGDIDRDNHTAMIMHTI